MATINVGFPGAFSLGVWDTVSSVGWVWGPEGVPLYEDTTPGVSRSSAMPSRLDERPVLLPPETSSRPGGAKQDCREILVRRPFTPMSVGGYPAVDGSLWAATI